MSDPQTPSTRNDTKENILDAAEALFAEQGIEAASLRAITARAGVNLAAVHYHFQSKEGLIRAVFSRRIEPINQERLRLLDTLEANGRMRVDDVLYAFIAPVIRGGGPTPTFRRLMGRIYADAAGHLRTMLKEHFVEVAERFPRALARALPDLPREELLWRFHFLLGSMIQVTLNHELIHQHSLGACDPADAEALIERLVAYSSAGFRAPLPGQEDAVESPAQNRYQPPSSTGDWAVWES